MKRLVFCVALLLILTGVSGAAFTHLWSYVDLRSDRMTEPGGPFDLWANEVEDRLDGTSASAGIKLTTFKLGTTTFTLPTADGTNGQVLETNGSGTLAWATPSGTWSGGAVSTDATLANGVDLLSDTTIAHTNSLQGYDTDGTAYVDVLRWTNGTTVAAVIGAATESLAITSTGLNVSTGGNLTGIGTFTSTGDYTAGADGLEFKSDVTTAHTIGIDAYDVDGTTYRHMLLATNGNTPAAVLGNAYSTVAITSTGFNVDTAGAVTGLTSATFSSGTKMCLDIVAVSNAEIKTLYSSPKTLVAAVSGSIIDVMSVNLLSDGGSTGFNSVSNAIGVYYNTGAGAACTGTIAQNAILSTSSSTDLSAKLIPVAVTGTASTGIVNVPVVLACATADPTTGNGVMRVAISYRVIPTSY